MVPAFAVFSMTSSGRGTLSLELVERCVHKTDNLLQVQEQLVFVFHKPGLVVESATEEKKEKKEKEPKEKKEKEKKAKGTK
jgi:hypothetical protein